MKKNKFITLVSSIIALATVSFTAIAAHAADDSIVLELNSATTETSKVVDVYYEGETATVFESIEMNITVDGVTPSSAVSMSTELKDSMLVDFVDGAILATLVSATPIEVENNKFLIGTLTIPVEAGAGAFTLEVTYFDDCDSLYSPDGSVNLGSLTIPGATVEEDPVEVKTEGALYNTFADAHVYASVADAVTISDITDKKLTWNIKNAEGTVIGSTDVNTGTVLSGEEGSTAVFGLIIVDDGDAHFAEIASTVLVIE